MNARGIRSVDSRGLTGSEQRGRFTCARRGFILVAALWLLVALGAVGLDASLRSRVRRLAAANQLDAQRAQDIALSATEYARSRLTAAMLGRADELRAEAARLNRNPRVPAGLRMNVESLFRSSDPAEDPWRDPAGLVEHRLTFDGANTMLQLRDVGAALNPNFADEVTLTNFFSQGLRLDYGAAQRLTMAILDWIDEDDLPRINGGEREQYLQAGAPVLPANRRFSSIEEMQHVVGMTPQIYHAMRPFLTLAGSGRININAAPEEVLLALPGMTPGAADELLRLRRTGALPRNFNELRNLLPAGSIAAIMAQQQAFSRRVAYVTTEVEITAEVRVPNSPVRALAQVVVGRTSTAGVVVWRKVS